MAAVLSKHHKCERCPYEHTRQCESCDQDKQQEPVEITIEKAIKYFEEENERYENILGDQAGKLPEYRMNLMAIDALKKVIL